MMNRKTSIILLELLAYTLLFILSLTFFPVCNFYYLGLHEEMITKPQYFIDFKVAYTFPLYLFLVLISFLSLKKRIIRRMNFLVLLLILFTYIFISMGFVWWGASPFHPDFQAGYWLSQLLLLVVIIRSYTLIKQLPDLKLNPRISRIFSFLSWFIPFILFAYLFEIYYLEKNKPIMRSESAYATRNRWVKYESWDYIEAHNAFVTKYYSTDTMRKEKYRLDSASFMFFDGETNITNKFTKRSKNGKIALEEVLEDHD
jgi:hypothetical protein